MKTAKWQGYWEEHTGRLIWLVVAVWTVLVGASLMWNLHQAREFVFELARNEANLSYEKDLAYRLWAAKHGGVYVPATPQSPPNPYLSHVPERDIKTPAGRNLTLVNPAYMTRQVHELTAQLYGSRGHLTSLKPLRPGNAPDAWETEALKAFEGGASEVIEPVTLQDQPYLRLMRVWRTEQACLGCHAGQGYKVGDIRGGISVAVPLQAYLTGIRKQTINLLEGHGLIWLLGLAGIAMGGRRIRKHLQERREAEAELAETLRQKDEALAQMARLASFPQLNPNPVLEIDTTGIITFANQAARDVVQQLAPGATLQDFLPRDWQVILESMRKDGAGNTECEVRLKDRIFSESIAFVEKFDVWRIYARDISKRVQAEAAVRESQRQSAFLADLLESSSQPFAVGYPDGRLETCNQAYAELLGYNKEEFLALDWARDLTPSEWLEIEQAKLAELQRSEQPVRYEKEYWHKDGSRVPVELFVNVRRDDLGQPLYYYAFVTDITERHQAEAKLRESEARFRSLFENMAEGVVMHELIYGGDGRAVNYRLLSANPAFEKHTGLSIAAIEGKTGSQAYRTAEAPYLDTYARVARTGEPAAFETYFPPLQRYFHISVTSPQKDHFVTVFEDVTARVRMEEALRRSHQRLDLLAESAGQLLVSAAPQMVVDIICPKVMEFLECDVFFNFMLDELSGRLHLNAYAGVPATEAARIEWLEYGVAVCGCAARDGCRIVAEDIQATLDSRTEMVKSYGIQAYACHPLVIQGQVLGTLYFGTRRRKQFTPDELALMKAVADQVAIAMDRKGAEEKLRQHAAELARLVNDLEQKNAEMERFVYMISHDLKSPLVTISTFLGYLAEDLAKGDSVRVDRDMGHMHAAADKMSRLLSELLEMSRVGRMVNQPVIVTFQELVQEALVAVAGPLAGRGLEVDVEGADLVLFGDRTRLVEIWQNLLENAIKFMGEQPAPAVRIGFQQQEGDTVFFVCDNGIGIEPRYHQKIFSIFEKLDVGTEGTGIGLALAKRIVELHQGKIWVESVGAGQGACFRFTLPGALKGEGTRRD